MNFALVTREKVEKAQKGGPWSVGNEALYNMCQKYPGHKSCEEIVGKIWLIGRSYSAAIERRKGYAEMSNDQFYTEHVVKHIRESGLDDSLGKLLSLEMIKLEHVSQILKVHKDLTSLFKDISGQSKRSLASKYLHFHNPNIFFIYDSLAKKSLSKLSSSRLKQTFDSDAEYERFFLKCMELTTCLENEYGVNLTPRQIDNLLLSLGSSD